MFHYPPRRGHLGPELLPALLWDHDTILHRFMVCSCWRTRVDVWYDGFLFLDTVLFGHLLDVQGPGNQTQDRWDSGHFRRRCQTGTGRLY